MSETPDKTALRRALLETRAVYRLADAAYAPYSCPASGECCQLSKTRREPWLYPSEWKILRETGALPAARPDGGCRYLDASGRRCSVYADRPFGCRTFFCDRIRGPLQQPGQAVDSLLRRLDALNREAFVDAEPRPLTDWIRREEEASRTGQ